MKKPYKIEQFSGVSIIRRYSIKNFFKDNISADVHRIKRKKRKFPLMVAKAALFF